MPQRRRQYGVHRRYAKLRRSQRLYRRIDGLLERRRRSTRQQRHLHCCRKRRRPPSRNHQRRRRRCHRRRILCCLSCRHCQHHQCQPRHLFPAARGNLHHRRRPPSDPQRYGCQSQRPHIPVPKRLRPTAFQSQLQRQRCQAPRSRGRHRQTYVGNHRHRIQFKPMARDVGYRHRQHVAHTAFRHASGP